jgi:hypothetical protein
MKNLRGALPGFGVGIKILLSSVSLALLGQSPPAGGPFQISTPSNGEATPSEMDFVVAVETGWLHPDLRMKLLAGRQ